MISKCTFRQIGSWRPLFFTGFAFVGLLAIGWAVLGRAVVEKLVTDLAMPLGLLWIGLSVLCVYSWRRRQRASFVASTACWCLCFLAGNGIVAEWLIGSLEDEYKNVEPLAAEPYDAVVLLGGGVGETPAAQPQVNENGDRVVLAARLYHRGLTKKIYCTGAAISGLSSLEHDEAELSRQLLVGLAVPDDLIQKLAGRNTAEEMQEITKATATGARIGIITSAWHMGRAMRLAEHAEIRAEPLPANFLSGSDDRPEPAGAIIRRCIPNHGALSLTSRALREYLARLVGR